MRATSIDSAASSNGGSTNSHYSYRSRQSPVEREVSEEELSGWMQQFRERMEQKETEKEKIAMQRSLRASAEIQAAQERKEKERLQEQLEAQRVEEERLAAEAKAAAEAAEESRIDHMTSEMSTEERAIWIEDDAEISKIEAEMAAREQRMETVGGQITALVNEYEDRLRREERQAQEEIEREERERQAFSDEQRAERQSFEDGVLVEREEFVLSEEIPEREELFKMYEDERLIALDNSRAALYHRLPNDIKGHIDSLESGEEKNQFYDEVMQLQVLDAELDRLLGKTKKEEISRSGNRTGSAPAAAPIEQSGVNDADDTSR